MHVQIVIKNSRANLLKNVCEIRKEKLQGNCKTITKQEKNNPKSYHNQHKDE